MEAGIPNQPKRSVKSESGMKTLSDVQGSPRFVSSVRFLREPGEGVRHPHNGESRGEGSPGVESAGDRRWEEAQGEGHAPGTDGHQARRQQGRSSGRHFSKKMKWGENLLCLNIWRRELDNRQGLELN